ncbi:MAG: hydrogenase nickel incorporation protein HypB [Dechloromonas sp.]|nr:hydrogenase nickel incorporation protein HypB [Dechloromonas sp.]
MCTVCGCGAGETRVEGEHEHTHVHADGTVHTHAHDHGHEHDHSGGLDHHHSDGHGEGHHDHGTGPVGTHMPGMSQARMVQIEQDILSRNNAYAAANRRWFDERGIFALNFVSSPGSGKTALLCRTIELLRGKVAISVIEGDQQTSNDAERIRATGAKALQINTGKGCHLDGHMVGHAIEQLQPAEESLVAIENVGNLVCPAAFELGEHHKVVILSVTEGEDKPLKYPDMFAAADVMLLNKIDLLPYVEFDADLAEAYARRVNPDIVIFRLSATTGEGMTGWIGWVAAGLDTQRSLRSESLDALKRRIAELERQLAEK